MNVNALRSALALVAVSLVATGCAATAEDTSDESTSLGTTAQAQTKEHILLARQVGLTTLARSMGTRDGRIVVIDAAGAQKSFVMDGVVYTAGAPVYESSRPELCAQTRTGLASCSTIAAAQDATSYECGVGACECYDMIDCIDMVLTGPCDDGTLVCSSGGCTCTG